MRWKCDYVTLETYVKSDTSKRDTVFALNGCAFETYFWTPLRTRWFEIYVKLSTSNRIWNIRSIRVWALCQTSFSGYPVPLRAFELLNLVNSQPFSLIYRRRFLCLSSALLLACAFSQRLFAWPLLLRPDRLITTKLPGEINPLFLSYVKSFGLAFETYAKLNTSKILAYPRFLLDMVWDLCKTKYLQTSQCKENWPCCGLRPM